MNLRPALHAIILVDALLRVGISGAGEPNPQQLQAAREKGDATSCSNLGVMYTKGQGVKRDDKLAAALYRKACGGGIAGGCFNLGVMYDDGREVEQVRAQAVNFFGKACDLKNQQA